MRQRDRDRVLELVAHADALADALDAEKAARGEPADRDDESRMHELELPPPPELAEVLLGRSRRPVAAAARRRAGVAAGHGRAVERRVELVLVEVEPAAERASRAAAPRQPFEPLLLARRLSEDVCALAAVRLHDRQ